MDPEIGPYSRIKRKRIPFPGEEDEDCKVGQNGDSNGTAKLNGETKQD